MEERETAYPVLADVIRNVTTQTPFRRAAAFLYEGCVTAGASDPKTRVQDFVTSGIDAHQQEVLRRLIADGEPMDGERFRARNRIGDVFFYPKGEGLPPHVVTLPSRRAFLGSCTWDARDVLLAPFWLDGGIQGHISVDDPRDGARPDRGLFKRLESIAHMSAIALCKTCDLERLSETHRVFRLLAECALTGILVIQEERIRFVNERAVECLGYDRKELLSLVPWWQVLHPDDRPSAWAKDDPPSNAVRRIRAIRRDGRPVWFALGVHELQYDQGQAMVVQFFDVTERVEVEEQLKARALRDPLTGLLNRAYFDDAAQIELQRSRRYKRPFTLMIADLARFKQVNDRLGHQEGDRVLIGISSVLSKGLRESDWVVRYGGDEFLFFLSETGGDLETLETRLAGAVRDWCRGDATGIDVEVDFGWATWSPGDEHSIAELLKEADTMLYRKKAERSPEQPPRR